MYSIFENSTNTTSWADNPHRRGTQEILTWTRRLLIGVSYQHSTSRESYMGACICLPGAPNSPQSCRGVLWRLASCFIIGFVPASTLVLLMEKLFFAVINARSVGHKPTKKFLESFFGLMYRYKVWLVLFGLGLLADLWARVYLVVECFIGLFHSPDGVYNLPPWSAYVPHIT